MSNKETICDTIKSFGSVGIKKTELKKRFEVDNFDTMMDELLVEDRIAISKKGSYIFCWEKQFFLDYLLNSDLKFKYLYNSIATIQDKINNYSDSIFQYIEKIDNEIVEVKNSFLNIENKIKDLQIDYIGGSDDGMQYQNLSLNEFKEIFDKELIKKSSSIGWVELSTIKNVVCQYCNIEENDFYNFVSDLIDLYPEKYELSSGGYEGVILRGIVHGFVRYL